MNWLMYVNWLAGPLLQITLLIFMVLRKSNKQFPRFFSYILFQTLKSACLFVVYRYFPEESYFDAYWTGNAVSVIFTVVVMDEILRSLFKEYGGIQILGTTIFRWSCGLLFLFALLGALSSSEAGGDRLVAAVFSFDRSMRLMQVGLFLILMLLCRFLRNYSRQQVFGIALGFGVFASVELILVSIVMWYGNGQAAMISLVKSTAYNAVTLLWIGYLKQQPQLVPKLEAVPNANPFGMALAASADVPDPDAGFMLRVEQAVDRLGSQRLAETSCKGIPDRQPQTQSGRGQLNLIPTSARTMKSTADQLRTEANWPPREGQIISFTSSTGSETTVLKEVRWGLVWRDFILEDGRVIPEHRISGCPQPQAWRKINEVTDSEREECEERLLSMARAGMDPHEREQSFWAELNQYLAYTYLRFKPAECKLQDAER